MLYMCEHLSIFPQLGPLQTALASASTNGLLSHTLMQLGLSSILSLPHCIPATLPPTDSLSFLPFYVFVPKLQSNSFLRAVLLEFNPPSLSFQPLFHCGNLGSDLAPF